MESIYAPETFAATIRFPLKSYFEVYKTLPMVKLTNIEEQTESEKLLTIGERMEVNLDAGQLQTIAAECSIDQLTCLGENLLYPIAIPEPFYATSKLPESYLDTVVNEGSLEVQKFKSEFTDDDVYHLINKNNKKLLAKEREFDVPSSPPDLTPGCEFAVLIRVYRPFKFAFFSKRNNSERLQFSQEIIALGRNTLTELRDAIHCSLDLGICHEVESTSDELRGRNEVKKEYPSGFIFIDNTFYNDMREPSAVNYSTPIIAWAKENQINGLKATVMENVQIDSLNVRFGYPYLYMHQGDCEHILVFSDARLLMIKDCLHSQSYPHVLKYNRRNNRLCFLCSVSFAKWLCIDCDRLPQSKIPLCTECCNSYNYLDGKKVGSFKLYPYYDTHIE